MTDVSIIICTRDRADQLRQTLESMRAVEIPPDFEVELIVADNASTDRTRQLVSDFNLPGVAVRYLYEARPGKGHAYSAGIRESSGEILMFTDDDLRLPSNWMEGMCEPILSGRADAVAGGVRFAKHLDRPWLEPWHRSWLASTETINRHSPERMVGANMAFSRRVLHMVPEFDIELGAGALGFADETLFSLQLLRAGFVIAGAFDVEVEHHFDPRRLEPESFMGAAAKLGQSEAYIAYHWSHARIGNPVLRLVRAHARFAWWRLRKLSAQQAFPNSVPVWKLQQTMNVAYHRAYLQEIKRPRNYEQFGLRKLRGAANQPLLDPGQAGQAVNA